MNKTIIFQIITFRCDRFIDCYFTLHWIFIIRKCTAVLLGHDYGKRLLMTEQALYSVCLSSIDFGNRIFNEFLKKRNSGGPGIDQSVK
jgi:hypothetical protein